uniref:Fibronectin type-III domain-containing protein n=1 Tax=Amphimedon queenslandica TaxID=400682 RepID=A0A1X7UFB7_AMPQE
MSTFLSHIQDVQCTDGSGANLSIHINPANGFLGVPGEGWYKCCLPTNCSDPNTNIIFANIFRYAEIESFVEHNGLITGYTVIISNSSITYNLTSTERYIILIDLVFGTEYNISVAAVNSVGRGPFSDPIVVEIRIVGSVSSIMDTTWAVISWSVPSYIPSDYPIITYEIGYHILQSGIYLMHCGNCYPNGSYFWDSSVNAVTKNISCVLPGTSLTTGQWVRVADPDDPVDCNSNSDSDPFHCTSVTSPDATINLYLAEALSAAQEGWYKCCLPTDCSDPNTNIIFANIFRYSEIKSFTVAELPFDMTVYPQEYKLNCVKIGHFGYGISMSIGNTALDNYTNCNDISNPCPGTVLVSTTYTIRYTVNITWDGMTVSSGSISQSTTGDQTYQCRVVDHPDGYQIRIRNVTIKVPATAPSSLTEVNKTATTITVSWTALDSSDADGYVVNVTSDTDTVQTVQVEGSSNNTITLNGLRGGTTYSITVRAYQQLLGPASSTISVQTLPVINSINWTLVSSITQLNNTQYRIDCLTTTDINPSNGVYWLVNGVMKSNSMYTSIDVLTYKNTLLVYPDPLGVSVNVTCIAMIGGVNYSQSVILHAPGGPPNNVRWFILNATSIKVNWTNSSETNGYVIEYTTGGVARNVVSTIPSPVTSLSVSNVSTTGITVNWTIPSSDNYVTYYTISYTPSCLQLSSVNETVSVAPHQSTTTYSYTLIGLYSGMNYTITVRAGNVLGGSELSMNTVQTKAIIPSGWPSSIQASPVNLTANKFTWNKVNCSQRNGLIKGYTVIISNSSMAYNLTSTERYIILNDLVFGTEYNFSVAAVNSVGRGPFSDPIVVEIGIVFTSSVQSSSSTLLTTEAMSTSSRSTEYCSITCTSVCTATPAVSVIPSTSDTSDSVIALSVLVSILCGLLTVSVIVHIYCFIRKKSQCTINKQTKADDDISMQVCEPYEIHKTKQSEENEGVYEECQTSPDAVYEHMPQ